MENIPCIRWWNIITLNQKLANVPNPKESLEIQDCMFSVFASVNPRRVLVSIPGSSPGLLCAACSPGSIFKTPENKWVWVCPAFICFMVKFQEEDSWHSVLFPRVFLFQIKIDYIVWFVSDCNYFYPHRKPHVMENDLCMCMTAYLTHIWILFTLICFPYSSAELKTNGGYFNIYEAHLPVYLAHCL